MHTKVQGVPQFTLMQNSKLVWQNSNPVAQNSNPVMQTSNHVVQTSNRAMQTSNRVMQNSNPVMQTSNRVMQTSKPSVQNSNRRATESSSSPEHVYEEIPFRYFETCLPLNKPVPPPLPVRNITLKSQQDMEQIIGHQTALPETRIQGQTILTQENSQEHIIRQCHAPESTDVFSGQTVLNGEKKQSHVIRRDCPPDVSPETLKNHLNKQLAGQTTLSYSDTFTRRIQPAPIIMAQSRSNLTSQEMFYSNSSSNSCSNSRSNSLSKSRHNSRSNSCQNSCSNTPGTLSTSQPNLFDGSDGRIHQTEPTFHLDSLRTQSYSEEHLDKPSQQQQQHNQHAVSSQLKPSQSAFTKYIPLEGQNERLLSLNSRRRLQHRAQRRSHRDNKGLAPGSHPSIPLESLGNRNSLTDIRPGSAETNTSTDSGAYLDSHPNLSAQSSSQHQHQRQQSDTQAPSSDKSNETYNEYDLKSDDTCSDVEYDRFLEKAQRVRGLESQIQALVLSESRASQSSQASHERPRSTNSSRSSVHPSSCSSPLSEMNVDDLIKLLQSDKHSDVLHDILFNDTPEARALLQDIQARGQSMNEQQPLPQILHDEQPQTNNKNTSYVNLSELHQPETKNTEQNYPPSLPPKTYNNQHISALNKQKAKLPSHPPQTPQTKQTHQTTKTPRQPTPFSYLVQCSKDMPSKLSCRVTTDRPCPTLTHMTSSSGAASGATSGQTSGSTSGSTSGAVSGAGRIGANRTRSNRILEDLVRANHDRQLFF